MPSIDGGDQCGPDYAPHMWVAGKFVWQTRRRIQLKKWVYLIGRTEAEEIVCERYREGAPIESLEEVPFGKIPDVVLKAIEEVSFGQTREEHRRLVEMLSRRIEK